MPKILHSVVWAVEELQAMLHGRHFETVVDGVHEFHQVDSPRMRKRQVEDNGQQVLIEAQPEPRPQKEKTVPCQYCDKKYTTKGHMELHVRKAHPYNPDQHKRMGVRRKRKDGEPYADFVKGKGFKCKYCDTYLSNRQGLGGHIQGHIKRGDKPLEENRTDGT